MLDNADCYNIGCCLVLRIFCMDPAQRGLLKPPWSPWHSHWFVLPAVLVCASTAFPRFKTKHTNEHKGKHTMGQLVG